MSNVKKIKADAPLHKKITREEEEIPSLRLKERIPTATKIKRDLMGKKGKSKS